MDSNYFATRYAPHPGRVKVWKAICEYLARFIPASSRVADIGAGYCDFINQVHAETRYAVDVTSDTARWCAPDVRFVQTKSIVDVDLPASSIDAAMLSNVLEHLWPQECAALFDRLEKILAPAATVIVIQPNYFYCYRRYWDDFTHVRAFSHESLRDFLVSRGYDVVSLEQRFVPFSFKSSLPKSYWLTKLYLRSPWRPMASQMLAVVRR